MDPFFPKIKIKHFGITDVGLVRKQNEDQILIADLQLQRTFANRHLETVSLGGKGMLYVVCDGMGGAAAGEVASQVAVETMFSELKNVEAGSSAQNYAQKIDSAIQKANARIHQFAKEDPTKKGMGTTISVAAVLGNQLFLAQVGDSRAYLFRKQKLYRITKDQSLLEHLLQEGSISEENAASFTGRNVILQALGPKAEVLVDLKFLPLHQDDMVLLCSDGLHGVLEDSRMEEILSKTSHLEQASHVLLNEVLEGGAPDNVSFVLFHLHGEDLTEAAENAEVKPLLVKYARNTEDSYTQQIENELGLFHKVGRSTAFWVILAVVAVLSVGSFLWLTQDVWKKVLLESKGKASRQKKGSLLISSDVKDAEVYVNKRWIGKLDKGLFKQELSVGSYSLYLKNGSWQSPVSSFELGWGQKKLFEISLQSKSSENAKQEEYLPGQTK